jgi:hypothetical protein
MRNRSSATEAQIYWATVADPVLSETKVVSFPVVANDPGFTTYTVEVGAHPNWSNHIVTTVRLDPVANVSTGRIEIDWISVNDSVNLAPWFSKGLDETINEDAGPRSVGSWATSISPGSTNETTQMLTFIVTNNNPGLFAAQPALSSNGTLSYTPAANSNGSTLVTVELRDDGGTVRGGQDTSPPQTFRITVNAVNDPPSFTKGADLTTAEDSGPHTIVAWASNIRAGPPNETAQTLTFLVTNDNGALFAVEPALGNSGTLTFRPATNAYGLATVTVRLRDNGGTANGGQDTSTSQSLTITVMPVNDPPVAGPDGIFTHWNTVLTLPKATLLTNDFDVDGDTLEIVAASALSTNGGTVVLSNNVVLYRPVSNFVGGDRFTYTVSDGQGSNAIGVVAAQVVQPRLSRAEHLTDGPFQFWFNGIPDSSYTVQASTNLSNWISLGTQATGNTGQFQFLDAASPVLPRRFYRAVCP